MKSSLIVNKEYSSGTISLNLISSCSRKQFHLERDNYQNCSSPKSPEPFSSPLFGFLPRLPLIVISFPYSSLASPTSFKFRRYTRCRSQMSSRLPLHTGNGFGPTGSWITHYISFSLDMSRQYDTTIGSTSTSNLFPFFLELSIASPWKGLTFFIVASCSTAIFYTRSYTADDT